MRPTTRIAATVLALLLPALTVPSAPTVAATVEPFALASAASGVVLGPDGNLWVAEQFNDTVARVSPAGAVIARYPVGESPTAVATGAGGRVWVAVTSANKLTWFDATSPTPTAHDVAIPSACGPAGLVSGGDGRTYFSCAGATKIGSVKDDGTDVVAADVGAGQVFDLAVSNGKLFAPDFDGDVVRRFALGTTLTPETTVAMPSGTSGPDGITADGAGQLWVTAYNSSQILRFPATQTLGAASVVPVAGNTLSQPFGIVASADGFIYTTSQSGSLVRISADGASSTAYTLGGQPYVVADGPDGDLFVTDRAQARIIRFVNSAPRATSAPAAAITTTGVTASATVNPRGNETTVVFDYGTSASYGKSTKPQVLATGAAPLAVSSTLTGLKPNTRYHLRVRATNAEGTTLGNDVVFTTRKLPTLAARTTFAVAHGRTSVIKRLKLTKLRGGETVTIRCAGPKCPFKAKTYKGLKKGQRVFAKSLWKGRHLTRGTKVTVRVTAARTIGRSTVLTVRRGRAPLVVRACLQPGSTRPSRC